MWKINKERYGLCYKYFVKLSQQDADGSRYVKGRDAAEFLLKSGLTKATIARILQMADLDNDQRLDRDEFVVAHHLAICISKEQMP